MYIKGLLEKVGVTDSDLTHVFVQTAYVNSSSTRFLKEKGIHNELCPTCVKNAHPIVVNYDIGAKDEPNGHGTIVCKWDRVRPALACKMDTLEAKKIVGILQLSNMTVGDEQANLFLIESILRDLGMSIEDFSTIYEENPSRLNKAIVKDRTKFKTIWDESRLTTPEGLQAKIDELVAQCEEGKAFVRPSATEYILRLYAEARTVEQMKGLAKAILADIEQNHKEF
jgi:phosphoacetylglucosamine mutase